MARAARGEGARAERGPWKWWQGMLAGMLLMLAPGAAMLLLILSAPLLLVMIAEAKHKQLLMRNVALFALAGAIEPLRRFAMAGHDLAAALDLLAHPATVLFVWLCAGFGWLLNELLCLGASFVNGLRQAAQRRALEAALLQIRTEWELPETPSTSP